MNETWRSLEDEHEIRLRHDLPETARQTSDPAKPVPTRVHHEVPPAALEKDEVSATSDGSQPDEPPEHHVQVHVEHLQG